jgi:hypothetical protein
MLKEEIRQVEEIARRIAKEEIALAKAPVARSPVKEGPVVVGDPNKKKDQK